MSVQVAEAQTEELKTGVPDAEEPLSSALMTDPYQRHPLEYKDIGVNAALEIVLCGFSNMGGAVLSLHLEERTPEITGILVQELLAGEMDGLYYYTLEAMGEIAPEWIGPALYLRSFGPHLNGGNAVSLLAKVDRELTGIRASQLCRSDNVSDRLLALSVFPQIDPETRRMIATILREDEDQLVSTITEGMDLDSRSAAFLEEPTVGDQLTLAKEILDVTNESVRRERISDFAEWSLRNGESAEFSLGVLAAASRLASVKESRDSERVKIIALQALKNVEQKHFNTHALYDRLHARASSPRYSNLVA